MPSPFPSSPLQVQVLVNAMAARLSPAVFKDFESAHAEILHGIPELKSQRLVVDIRQLLGGQRSLKLGRSADKCVLLF